MPVLFGDDEDQAIRALIQSRVSVGVEESNVYVFAAPTRGSKKWLRGNDCMNKVLKKIEDKISREDRFNRTAQILCHSNSSGRSNRKRFKVAGRAYGARFGSTS